MSDLDKAKEVKRKYEQTWLSIDGVSAVGIGLVDEDKVGIIISVETDASEFRDQIPTEDEGIPIKIQVTGRFKAQ